MVSFWKTLSCAILIFVFLLCSAHSLFAFWQTGFGVSAQNGGALGTQVGISNLAHDGYDGGGPLPYHSGDVGVFVLAHYVEGEHGWNGPTGFYTENYELASIPLGGNKTWWDFYLWSQNHSAPIQADVTNDYEPGDGPPSGYTGHIVIDQIPAGITWTGPMDYWFDMTKRRNVFAMPIAEVTDPLQGTRFHLTVYAVPEPSSLAALGFALAGLGIGRIRRKRA